MGGPRPCYQTAERVKLHAPVERALRLVHAVGALLGCAGCNNLVPLGGYAIMARCRRCLMARRRAALPFSRSDDGGNDLVGAFRGPGKRRLVMGRIHSLLASWSADSHVIRHAGS